MKTQEWEVDGEHGWLGGKGRAEVRQAREGGVGMMANLVLAEGDVHELLVEYGLGAESGSFVADQRLVVAKRGTHGEGSAGSGSLAGRRSNHAGAGERGAAETGDAGRGTGGTNRSAWCRCTSAGHDGGGGSNRSHDLANKRAKGVASTGSASRSELPREVGSGSEFYQPNRWELSRGTASGQAIAVRVIQDLCLGER